MRTHRVENLMEDAVMLLQMGDGAAPQTDVIMCFLHAWHRGKLYVYLFSISHKMAYSVTSQGRNRIWILQ